MAGIITTGNHPKALWPGINAWFGATYNRIAMQHTLVFDAQSSDMNYEEDVEIKGFGLASLKTDGGSVAYTSNTQGWTKRYTHVVYGLGYIVTREEMEDNKYTKVSMSRSGALARSMRTTKETVMANIINRAFNTAYLGGDGKPMIALDHPTDVGAQSNRLTIDADLSEASLEDATIQLRNAVDSTGIRINLQPRKLIIPVNEMYNASRILKSTGQNDTANNAINALRERGVFPDGVLDWTYLTDPDAWFIKTDAPDGLKLFNRRELEFTKDNDFDTENAKAKSTMRFSGGWTDWRSIMGTPGA